MSVEAVYAVVLVAVDDSVLDELVHVATTDAAADEVTPPLTAGQTWTPSRVAWLYDFHRERRAGLGGPAGEATWAAVIGERVVGSARWKLTEESGVFETGVWLTRASRGRGVGRIVLAAVLQEAAAVGATEVRADTTVGNAGALSVLLRLGFDLSPADNGHGVRAVLVLASARDRQCAVPEQVAQLSRSERPDTDSVIDAGPDVVDVARSVSPVPVSGPACGHRGSVFNA